ncbi:MAG: hypothetical protein V2A74_13695 [bacterium]
MLRCKRSVLMRLLLVNFLLMTGLASASWWNPWKKEKYPAPPHPEATTLSIGETRVFELDPKQPLPQPCGVLLNKGDMIRLKPLEGTARQEEGVVMAVLRLETDFVLRQELAFRVSEAGELKFVCDPQQVKERWGPLRVEISREDPSLLKTAEQSVSAAKTQSPPAGGKPQTTSGGLVQYQGEWMTPQERDRRTEVEQKARGNTFDRGQWVTPQEKKAAEEIQRTLDEIRGGEHAAFPTPGKVLSTTDETPRFVVLNDTSGYLDLYISGPVSKKFVLAPKDKRDVNVPPGEYELGVRPEDRSIVPFHGFLSVDEGTTYSWRLFLVQSPAQP